MNKVNLSRGYLHPFFVIWIFCYIVFPSWLLPVSSIDRALIYLFLWVFFLVNGWLFNKWNTPYLENPLFKTTGNRLASVNHEKRILITVLFIFVLIQVYPMLMPIRTRGDEGYHANNGLEILKMMNIMTRRFLPIDFHWLFKLLTVLVLAIFVIFKRRKIKLGISYLIEKYKYLFTAVLVIFFLFHFIVVIRYPYHLRLHRFPPLSKIIHSFIYLLFFPIEFFVRLPQLIFMVLAACLLFKTVSLFRSKSEALFTALTFLCLPLVIYFANDGELEAGVLFFIILVSYFFLRHLKFGTHKDFILTIFSLGLGFLYKRPLLILIPVIWIFLFLNKYIKFDSWFKEKFLYYLKFTWIGCVFIIPWLVMTNYLPLRKYDLSLKNWLDIKTALIYLGGLPKNMGLLMTIILAVSIIYCFVKRRDWLFKYFFFLFLIIYIFITSDSFLYKYSYLESRFASYFSPSLAVILSIVIFDLLYKIRKKSIRIMFTVFLFGLLFIHSSIISPRFTGIDSKIVTFYKIKSRYVPYDKALSFVGKKFPHQTRIHVVMGTTPVNFYAYKYNALDQRYKLKAEENFDITMWIDPEDQNLENLHEYCLEKQIDYIIFPSKKWVIGYLNQALIDGLTASREAKNRFRLIKEFEFGGNRVYVSKVLKDEESGLLD